MQTADQPVTQLQLINNTYAIDKIFLLPSSKSSTKVVKHRIMQTTPYDSPQTPAYWCQRSQQNSNAVTPDRGENPAFTPVEAGTWFSDPGGMQGWVDLCYMKADRPGIELATCKSQVQHLTTKPLCNSYCLDQSLRPRCMVMALKNVMYICVCQWD